MHPGGRWGRIENTTAGRPLGDPNRSSKISCQAIKRRTRVATLFPNPESLLRLSSAILMEISEDWETGRVYLNLETT